MTPPSDLDRLLATIDGALADEELSDGMRWSPTPEDAADPHLLAYDGQDVPLPPQHYERVDRPIMVDRPIIATLPGRYRPALSALAFVPVPPQVLIVLEPMQPPRTTAEQLWTAITEALRPLIEEVGRAIRAIGDALCPAPAPPPPRPGPDDPRARALWAHAARTTGPPRIGPERRPGPRRGPAPTVAVVAPPRARQLVRR